MKFVDYQNKEIPVEWISVKEILTKWSCCDKIGIKDKNMRPIERVLEYKKGDTDFQYYLDLLNKEGFTQPLCYRNFRGHKKQMDGHHRLKAAITLGYKYIPYINGQGEVFLYRFGEWHNPNNQPLIHPENPPIKEEITL